MLQSPAPGSAVSLALIEGGLTAIAIAVSFAAPRLAAGWFARIERPLRRLARRQGLAVVVVGAVLPSSPLAHTLGFQPLPGGFFVALAGMVVCYLALIEIGKRFFYRAAAASPGSRRHYTRRRHLRRRAAYFSTSAKQG